MKIDSLLSLRRCHEDAGRTRLLVVVITALAGIGLTAFFFTARGGPAASPADTPAPVDGVLTVSAASQTLAGVTVDPARQVEMTMSVQAVGVLALDETRTSRVGSVVEGLVLRTVAEVGARVREGAVLAELHSHRIHDAQADYRKAMAERRHAEVELTFTTEAEQRAGRLLADKAVSLQDVERARVNRQAAEEALAMAKAEVYRSLEELEHLGLSPAEAESGALREVIPARSPITGVILERTVSAGTVVTPGTPLFVVSDLSSLWALVEVDEAQLPHLRVGLPVSLRVSAYPGQAFPARVSFVGDAIDPKTRRVLVRCQVLNAEGRLKPQMFATVTLDSGAPRPAIVVPAAAIQEVDGASVVFVQTAPDRFEKRAVRTGVDQGGQVEVVAGLRAGEPVAASGTFLLKSELLKASLAEEE